MHKVAMYWLSTTKPFNCAKCMLSYIVGNFANNKAVGASLSERLLLYISIKIKIIMHNVMCMWVCMYTCMCIFVCMSVCMCMCMCGCVCVWVCVCTRGGGIISWRPSEHWLSSLCACACMCVYVCACVLCSYACVCAVHEQICAHVHVCVIKNYTFSMPSRTRNAGAIAAYPRRAHRWIRIVSCKTDRTASDVSADERVVACAPLTIRPLLL